MAFAASGVQMTAADFEASIFSSSYRNANATHPVFVTSLARAGTTMLLEILHKLPELACHTYRDMPFILAPIFWSKLSDPFQKNAKTHERAHGDGIKIGFDSPEGFEEVFWKTFWPEHYTSKLIRMWQQGNENPEATSFLREHMKKIVALRHPESMREARYVSKNNANIARLALLPSMFPDATIIVVLRDPLEHANSLYRQHEHFINLQKQDAFVKRYMDDIGHYEFGALHRPIDFPGLTELRAELKPDQLDYWLVYWIVAFEQVMNFREKIEIVCYEDVCAQGAEALKPLFERISLNTGVELTMATAHVRPVKSLAKREQYDTKLVARAEKIYRTLLNRQ